VGALLVDVRDDSARATNGAIPGAVLVGKDEIVSTFGPEAAEADPRTLVLICGSGTSSLRLSNALREAGRQNVLDVAGGFRAWKAAGLPVSEG
jgi:rhodanese-related sulfurtransferase